MVKEEDFDDFPDDEELEKEEAQAEPQKPKAKNQTKPYKTQAEKQVLVEEEVNKEEYRPVHQPQVDGIVNSKGELVTNDIWTALAMILSKLERMEVLVNN